MNAPRRPTDAPGSAAPDAPGGGPDRRPLWLTRLSLRPLDSPLSADCHADALRLPPRDPGRPAPVPPCPTPGFNGAHYYAEVDPVTLAPAAATGYLRCRWCGANHPAPSFSATVAPVRVIREATPFEVFRPVREATW
ncbi:MAG: hypothetical protein QF719_07465 [Chloroflexota bacterium]|jgi:hypothetical protein|nr:hypothetical protein [Chloroflexota bacterium]MDP6508856.1 hypothetical protein [Chloroflexota bacterium]MDP6758036.1 hypothetical protein [Chloroflexota bacterium]